MDTDEFHRTCAAAAEGGAAAAVTRPAAARVASYGRMSELPDWDVNMSNVEIGEGTMKRSYGLIE